MGSDHQLACRVGIGDKHKSGLYGPDQALLNTAASLSLQRLYQGGVVLAPASNRFAVLLLVRRCKRRSNGRAFLIRAARLCTTKPFRRTSIPQRDFTRVSRGDPPRRVSKSRRDKMEKLLSPTGKDCHECRLEVTSSDSLGDTAHRTLTRVFLEAAQMVMTSDG